MNYRFSAYEALLHLREALRRYPNDLLQQEVEDLIEQVQNRKYVVAVAGEFNRGKSSLINALLGMPILPMDILPMTATANRIVYGLMPRVRIYQKNGSELQIRVDELKDYVTKQTDASSQNARAIRETVIEYPTVLCQNGLEILDTPGLNDTEEMCRITDTILKDAHGVVFVVSALMPLSMSEAEWLVRMLENDKLQYLMFAVTFFDRVAERDQEKVLNAIRERIFTMVRDCMQARHSDKPELIAKAERLTNPENIFLMPVSARDALDAFENGDDELLQKSGLPQFKIGLNTLLNAQQDEYVVRRADSLVGHVREWVDAVREQSNELRDSLKIASLCDQALEFYMGYKDCVEQKIDELQLTLETGFKMMPDAFCIIRDAAEEVLHQNDGSIDTNDDVHRVLNEATEAVRKAANGYYVSLWQEGGQQILLDKAADVELMHIELVGLCREVLNRVPQLMETAALKKRMWAMLGTRILPEWQAAWTLDITGGFLKDFVSNGQHLASDIGKAIGNTAEKMDKNSRTFRSIKDGLGQFMKKTGIAEKMETIQIPKLEIKEGQLIRRNLYTEIEPKVSEYANQLHVQWQANPKNIADTLRQIYLFEERLITDHTLQMALTQRKGEADGQVSQYRKNCFQQYDEARSCIEKAEKILSECTLAL